MTMSKPPAARKPTSKQMAEYLRSKRDAIGEAVHGTVNQGGMPAVTLHSVRLAIAHQDLEDSPCGQCGENEQCVFDPDSGQWVCAPK